MMREEERESGRASERDGDVCRGRGRDKCETERKRGKETGRGRKRGRKRGREERGKQKERYREREDAGACNKKRMVGGVTMYGLGMANCRL